MYHELLKLSSEDEPGLLFRSEGMKNHDYEPSWDYEIDEFPDSKLAKFTAEVAERVYKSLIKNKTIDKYFLGFEVWAAILPEDSCAMYIDGTYDFPVVLIDLKKHRKYKNQIGQSIYHELKHAIQDSEGTEYDEDEAENNNY